jgi:hypothetical protein
MILVCLFAGISLYPYPRLILGVAAFPCRIAANFRLPVRDRFSPVFVSGRAFFRQGLFHLVLAWYNGLMV